VRVLGVSDDPILSLRMRTHEEIGRHTAAG